MLLAALIIAFSIIKAARILSIRIKQTEHTGAYNFQTLNAPKFEEIKQESEKMLDEASILAEMHMKTRCPVGNFSKIHKGKN